MTRYYPHVAVFVRGLHAHPTWRLVAYNWLKSPLPLSLVVAMSGISSLKQYLQAEKASRGEQQKDVPDSDFLISVGGQAKLEEELFGDVKEPAATVSDNGRESAKKRARIETPSREEKQRRAQKRARPAETQSARGPSSLPSQALRNLGTSAVDATTENELKRKIASGLKEEFMSPEEAQALFEFCKELLPEATRIHTGQFKNLSKQAPKLFCYDVDADGWSPQYKFADMAPVDYHLQHSAINGTPLQGLCSG